MKSNLDDRTGNGDEETPHRGGPYIIYHDDFLLHDPSPYPHPENPERVQVALGSLLDSCGRSIEIVTPPRRDPFEAYSLVHDRDYMQIVLEASQSPTPTWIDPDTYVSPGTPKALARLAGAVDVAINTAVRGGTTIILGRPPGHHAGKRGPAMGAPTLGFCIFNTAALIARRLSEHGRVAVLDFDLHHGNGTQEILWWDSILHVDIHQDPSTIYPGTGFPEDIGGVAGSKVNIIVPPGSGDDIYIDAVEVALNLLRDYNPDYLVVSAGFDAYIGDFASMQATEHTFARIGRSVRDLAVPVIIVLEGGYTSGLKMGLPAFTCSLFGEKYKVSREPTVSSERAWKSYKTFLSRLNEALHNG
ncbi:MAG: histone deacetylase family protein [Desulfurococcales archaeon]|nr:histone deacetylase family protein [Desulfurococcales archaeon]